MWMRRGAIEEGAEEGEGRGARGTVREQESGHGSCARIDKYEELCYYTQGRGTEKRCTATQVRRAHGLDLSNNHERE